jgi:hypothetical protein
MATVVLLAAGAFVSLISESLEFERRRKLEVGPLLEITARYRTICERMTLEDPQGGTLFSLGRQLYAWLDGAEGWLGELRTNPISQFICEVRTGMQPDEAGSAVLHAPWELLADADGFLAADDLLRFAPARRIGRPREIPPDGFRLGVAFMAASPRGANELDYEAEENAILAAAPQRVDLFVDDSGDPEELGRRLAALEHPPQVLHLSCHGHDSWQHPGDSAPQPVLLMEDEKGDARPTVAGDLVNALGNVRPRVLFLSACLTVFGHRGRRERSTVAAYPRILRHTGRPESGNGRSPAA